jgi:hypothetical protein
MSSRVRVLGVTRYHWSLEIEVDVDLDARVKGLLEPRDAREIAKELAGEIASHSTFYAGALKEGETGEVYAQTDVVLLTTLQSDPRRNLNAGARET